MNEVIHYLSLKNEYFKKLFKMTKDFLNKARENKWDGMSFFIDNRDRVLNIIRYYDFKIAKHFEEIQMSPQELNSYRHAVKNLLTERDNLVRSIVQLDLELATKLDEIKIDTIRQLKEKQKTAKQLSSFATKGGKPRNERSA